MRKIIQKESTFCDKCGKESFVERCLKCGVEHCWECKKINGIEYAHAVYFTGSLDGYYCNDCNNKLLRDPDLIFAAYRKIYFLKMKEKGFYEEFRKESDAAEKHLKDLIEEGRP